MPWSDEPGPLPRRSEAELLALTRAKASALEQRRRRERAAGVAAAVVLGSGLVALLVHDQGRPGVEVRTASEGEAPTSVVASGLTAGSVGSTTTLAPPVLPFPPPPTTSPVASTTTSAGPPNTTPSPETKPWVFCEVSDYSVRVFTDRPVYNLGEQVRATIEVTNRSPRACVTRGHLGAGPFFRNASGEIVGGGRAIPVCPDDRLCGTELAPGAMVSGSWCWNLEATHQPPAPPGTYTAELALHGAEGTATFQLSGKPSPSPTSSLPQGVSCS